MSPNPRGGRRSGAGRKRLAPDGLISHNVTLSAEDWAFIEVVGNGNRSAGVRALLRPTPDGTPTVEPLRKAVLRFWAALDRLKTVNDDAAHDEYHAANTAVSWIAKETFKPVTPSSPHTPAD